MIRPFVNAINSASIMRRKVVSLFQQQQHFTPLAAAPTLQLEPSFVGGTGIENGIGSASNTNFGNNSSSLMDCLWLAVPKSKISRQKKRMKTTNQKAIKKKNHIIVDGRTGEITLRHRLPFNWKDYLPDV